VTPPAYYNEIDPYAAAWLRNLIAAGHIAAGEVDERSIEDVQAAELVGFSQVHMFCGIGGWSLALRLAGWPDDRPVWTGSCPCQPFSVAGKGLGTADARHLWPSWQRLIAKCRPSVVFGEQVASRAGRDWLASVRVDLEALGYAVGAADLCAAGAGAPHLRQRIYFCGLADAGRGGVRGVGCQLDGAASSVQGEAWEQRIRPDAGDGGDACGLADADNQLGRAGAGRGHGAEAGDGGRAGDASSPGLEGRTGQPGDDGAQRPAVERTGGDASFWAECNWIPCSDGKSRPAQPGAFPLANGVPGRVGKLRAYGNAIAPPLAAAFVRAVMGCRP